MTTLKKITRPINEPNENRTNLEYLLHPVSDQSEPNLFTWKSNLGINRTQLFVSNTSLITSLVCYSSWYILISLVCYRYIIFLHFIQKFILCLHLIHTFFLSPYSLSYFVLYNKKQKSTVIKYSQVANQWGLKSIVSPIHSYTSAISIKFESHKANVHDNKVTSIKLSTPKSSKILIHVLIKLIEVFLCDIINLSLSLIKRFFRGRVKIDKFFEDPMQF